MTFLDLIRRLQKTDILSYYVLYVCVCVDEKWSSVCVFEMGA